MRYRSLGQSDIEASVVALGAWAIGGWTWGGADDEESIRAVHAALDAGMNFIDTAPIYGFGHSEKVVGLALRDRRQQAVLATKCGLRWDLEKGVFYFYSTEDMFTNHPAKHRVHKYLGPESVIAECEASLKRLQTDYIDLYQTHWQDSTTAIEDTMATLIKLKEQGKIRAIGVCNATVEQVEEYRLIGPIASEQSRYSMFDRKLEEDLLPYCTDNNVAFLAYSPLEQGLLTGKITPDRKFSEGDQRAHKERFSVENRRKVLAFLEKLRPIAQAHNLTLAQLVIAWTIQQPGCTYALVGARSPHQVQENAAAGEVILSNEDLKTIDDILSRHAEKII
ncbi:MAG: aldo/keto reductase [Sedimentisphaerales bacterium]|nr:aldo/keto reductase [Sedimentisphaerales bacterium]